MTKEKKKTNHIFRFIFIFIVAFIILPLGIGALLYQTNENFKEKANKYMSKGPGYIGDYFNGYPTEEERNEKIEYIGKHFSNLDAASAADKLYIIKEKDESLYFDVINKMQQLPSKELDIDEVIKLVRNIELRKNTLTSTFDEIKKEKLSSFQQEISDFEKLELSLSINKIILDFLDDEGDKIRPNKVNELSSILDQMNDERVAEILFYLDKSQVNNTILESLPTKKADAVKHGIYDLVSEEIEFQNLAELYETKNPSEAFLDIGHSEKYSLDELSKLYYYIDVGKGAEILVQSDNSAFIEELFNQMSIFENLKEGQANKVLLLSNKLTEKKQYIQKVEDLSGIYEKIDNKEVVELLEKMMITNEELATDILRNMKRGKVAEILKMMEPRKAVQFSNSLVY